LVVVVLAVAWLYLPELRRSELENHRNTDLRLAYRRPD
jgi:hypothetical protein